VTSTLPGLLSRHAPLDRIATGSEPRTAAELVRDAGAIARALPPGRVGAEVVLVCHDRYLFAAAMLACIERGLVVALPPNAQPERVRELRKHPDVLTVLHDQTGMLGLDVRALVDGVSEATSFAPLPPLPPERPIVVVYTSGTTGAPMRCAKTAGQLVGEARVLRDTFAIAPGTPMLATVPPHHVYGLLFGVLVPLVSGASFTRETVLHAEPLAALARRDVSQILVSVPAHLRALRLLEPGTFPRLDHVFSSGAPLPRETAEALEARLGWRVTEALGSSETGGIGYRLGPDAPWTLFEGVTVDVDDEGRMLVDSPFLDPAGARPFVSGDRIEALGDRTFRLLGRADGVIKVGGTRISVAELEHRLLAIDGIDDAAVLPIEVGGSRGVEVWAVLVGRGHDAASIRKALVPFLDPVVIPRRVRFVDALARDANGKVRRSVLRALFDA
jgi:acyl-coenzyme A synthetase/AMP-(fatty) acid ligase